MSFEGILRKSFQDAELCQNPLKDLVTYEFWGVFGVSSFRVTSWGNTPSYFKFTNPQ